MASFFSSFFENKQPDSSTDTVTTTTTTTTTTTPPNQTEEFTKKIGGLFSDFVTKIKTSIEEEQKNFIAEQNKYKLEEPIKKEEQLPWTNLLTTDPEVGETIKKQILALPKNKRNFLDSPPPDAKFDFVYEDYVPLAKAAVEADPQLSRIRFYLVPKFIREPKFWRNYFYRVSVIKEAYGLSTIVTKRNNGQIESDPLRVEETNAANEPEPDPSQVAKWEEEINAELEDFDTSDVDESLLSSLNEELGLDLSNEKK
eukprot:TRINITY_DN18160_c0_g1_i1.p1 TRINITY_DN18160_c0_g1~~TRINITY_DN18160_c0_g1_i1.p1  ORF type:complete len:264 (-),score=63.03 TRINITY_DN18160_c0_g1_i1:122-889(-)